MTVQLGKQPSCISEPQGIISTTLVCLGYFKYALVIIIIVFYCIYFRTAHTVAHENDINLPHPDTEQFLSTHIAEFPNGEACSICMEENREETAVGLDCGHFFHYNCVRDWVRIRSSCPMCRRQVIA